MINGYNPEEESLFTAGIEEFRRELGEDYSNFNDLRDFATRYDHFRRSVKTLSGEEGRLCRELLKDAAGKLIQEGAKLIKGYEGRRVSNEDRETLTDIFLQLIEIPEEDLPEELKENAIEVSNDIARIGGLV
ncbi:Uncharacterised protein [uncultured archaeon]|nr:Uncharacterised protein [uncultured archaeon]